MAPKANEAKKMAKYGHAVPHGRSLIERIEIQMDKRRKAMEDIFVNTPDQREDWVLNKGRYEGMAASLALLRSSSVKEEVRRSNERLGIE